MRSPGVIPLQRGRGWTLVAIAPSDPRQPPAPLGPCAPGCSLAGGILINTSCARAAAGCISRPQ